MKSFAREQAYVAICMCFHPRNLKAEMRDEYLPGLAPDRALFRDWQEQAKKVGHDRAFAAVNYESRFQLKKESLADLHRLARMSEKKDVFLLCQCANGQRCHRELLLLTAREAWGTRVGFIYHDYATFQERLPALLRTEEIIPPDVQPHRP